jgi:hypothetical protein
MVKEDNVSIFNDDGSEDIGYLYYSLINDDNEL